MEVYHVEKSDVCTDVAVQTSGQVITSGMWNVLVCTCYLPHWVGLSSTVPYQPISDGGTYSCNKA